MREHDDDQHESNPIIKGTYMALKVARLSIKKESSSVRNLQAGQRKWFQEHSTPRKQKKKERNRYNYLIKFVLTGEL